MALELAKMINSLSFGSTVVSP